MSTDNKPAAAAEASAAKTFVAFFTPAASKGPKVELFKTLSDKARAPVADGTIDGTHVSLFVRKGPKGPFLGIVGEKLTDGSGKSEDLGAANVRTRPNGSPVLVINYGADKANRQEILASISKKVDQDLLVSLGLDPAKQAEKRANAAAAAVPAAKKAVAAKP